MSADTHTPGPWGVWRVGGNRVVTDNRLSRHLAQILRGAPEHEANARLIAAAPELLAALRPLASLIAAIQPEHSDDDVIIRDVNLLIGVRRAKITVGHVREAVAAIEKAEGRAE